MLVECQEDFFDAVLEAFGVFGGIVGLATGLRASVSWLLRSDQEGLAESINSGIAVGSLLASVPSLWAFIHGLTSL